MILGLTLRGVHIYQVTGGATASEPLLLPPPPPPFPAGVWAVEHPCSGHGRWLAPPGRTPPLLSRRRWTALRSCSTTSPGPTLGSWHFWWVSGGSPCPGETGQVRLHPWGIFWAFFPDEVQVPSCRPLGSLRAVLASRALCLTLALQALDV